jgi:hypothetical protein
MSASTRGESPETATPVGESLRRVAAFGAVLEVAVLCLGILGLIIATPALRPWLAVLSGINAELGEMSLESLNGINPIDIVVLALAATTFAGFWPGPGRPHKLWMGLAILLPLAGIAVLLVTNLQGRSGLMGGGFVMSLLLLGDRPFRPLGYLGLVANLVLFAGDFATTGAGSALIASLIAVGYVMLLIWFAWIAACFLSPGTCATTGDPPPSQTFHAIR